MKHLFLPTAPWLTPGRSVSQLSCDLNRPNFFFHRTPFLLERTRDKLWLFRAWHLVEIFLKMNKVSPSGKATDSHFSFPVIKVELSGKNYNFGKPESTTVNLPVPQSLKTFPSRQAVILR